MDSIQTIDPLLGEVGKKPQLESSDLAKSHYDVEVNNQRALKSNKAELEWWEPRLIGEGKLLEAQRLHQRTMFDLELIKEMGFCRGMKTIRGI